MTRTGMAARALTCAATLTLLGACAHPYSVVRGESGYQIADPYNPVAEGLTIDPLDDGALLSSDWHPGELKRRSPSMP